MKVYLKLLGKNAAVLVTASLCVFTLTAARGAPSRGAAPKSAVASETTLSKDYSIAQIQGLLKKVTNVLNQCEGHKAKSSNTTTHRTASGRPSLKRVRNGEGETVAVASTAQAKTGAAAGAGKPKVCGQKKMFLAMRSVLRAYLSEKQRNELAANQLQIVGAQNLTLKHTIESGNRSIASVDDNTSCYKTFLLRQLMVANGISANGGQQFSKLPLGPNATCWSNSKNKKEASVTLCDYPLAINVQTKGGTETTATTRKKEYIFSINKCDLVTVRVEDRDANGTRETYFNYDQCLQQWNKRTADAAMTPTQVRLMEDTIGYCFREHLLPPRQVVGGRVNPQTGSPMTRKPTGNMLSNPL